jgi:hypothetical protein
MQRAELGPDLPHPIGFGTAGRTARDVFVDRPRPLGIEGPGQSLDELFTHPLAVHLPPPILSVSAR